MITSIEIQGLRGIREGRIDGLAPLTILVGPNGCGKSTVLEALGVACAQGSATAAFQALSAREWLGLEGIAHWLRNNRATVTATGNWPRLSGDAGSSASALACRGPGDRAGQRHVVLDVRTQWRPLAKPHQPDRANSVEVNEDGAITDGGSLDATVPFALQSAFVDRPAGAAGRLTSARFSSALRDALSAIKLSPWYDELFEYLKVLRPTLTSIESIAVGDRDEPHIFERDPRTGRIGYPLAYAGDGFRRSLLLASAFARAKGGVAAVDEPEAFAHPGMFGPLTGLIRRAVGDGTQVVLATHSLEFVAAALQAFEDQPEKAAVVGLRMEAGALDPLVIAGPDAYQRVVEFGHDLRL